MTIPAHQILRNVFGHGEFRGQQEAIIRLVRRGDLKRLTAQPPPAPAP